MVNSSDSKTEERIASINYVITFYKDLQQLLHFYSLYVNSLAEFKNEIEKAKLSDEQKTAIRNITTNMRYHSTKCKLFVNSMGEEAKIDKEKKQVLEDSYKTFMSDFVPNEVALETYVSLLNEFFVTNVAKNILQNNAELLNAIYGGE